MTKTVIEIAREAGTEANQETHPNFLIFIERFAAIVREDEREKAAKKIEWYIGNNQEWFERTPEGLAEEIRSEK